jgi:hypothetical protein
MTHLYSLLDPQPSDLLHEEIYFIAARADLFLNFRKAQPSKILRTQSPQPPHLSPNLATCHKDSSKYPHHLDQRHLRVCPIPVGVVHT